MCLPTVIAPLNGTLVSAAVRRYRRPINGKLDISLNDGNLIFPVTDVE